jgi:4-amino-4-deoxy-L-arabinose transferase-like glycosyltransferase
LGEQEWVARLLPIVASLATMVLLWLLVRSCAGVRTATLSAAIFALLPMELQFGNMVNHEPLVLMWIMGLLTCLRQWSLTGAPRWAGLASACCLLGMWTGWHMYMFAVPLGALLIIAPRGRQRTLGYALLACGLVSILIFFTLIHLARADAWDDLWNAFQFRLGSMDQNKHGYTWTQWCRRVGGSLFINISPVIWILAFVGAAVCWQNRRRFEGYRWLGGAAAGIFAMDLFYVVVFRNASFIHGYAAFYFVAPVAMMCGIALNAWIQRSETGNKPLVRTAALCGIMTLLVVLGVSGFQTTRDLDRKQHSILDWKVYEPPDLVPGLARAIRDTFPEDTVILCNFLPAYGPHLHYYAQRNIWNNMNAYDEWEPVIRDPHLHCGGVIWMEAPGGPKLLSALPEGTRKMVSFGDRRFCLWIPRVSK